MTEDERRAAFVQQLCFKEGEDPYTRYLTFVLRGAAAANYSQTAIAERGGFEKAKSQLHTNAALYLWATEDIESHERARAEVTRRVDEAASHYSGAFTQSSSHCMKAAAIRTLSSGD